MRELMKSIGKQGTIYLGGLIIDVEVVDVKQAYGRDMYQVKPLAGTGLIWVTKVSLQ